MVVVQCWWDWGDFLVVFMYGFCFWQEIWVFVGVQVFGVFDMGSQQFFMMWLEGMMQFGNQCQCFGGQNVFVGWQNFGFDFYVLGQCECYGCFLEDDVRVECVLVLIWFYGWID